MSASASLSRTRQAASLLSSSSSPHQLHAMHPLDLAMQERLGGDFAESRMTAAELLHSPVPDDGAATKEAPATQGRQRRQQHGNSDNNDSDDSDEGNRDTTSRGGRGGAMQSAKGRRDQKRSSSSGGGGGTGGDNKHAHATTFLRGGSGGHEASRATAQHQRQHGDEHHQHQRQHGGNHDDANRGRGGGGMGGERGVHGYGFDDGWEGDGSRIDWSRAGAIAEEDEEHLFAARQGETTNEMMMLGGGRMDKSCARVCVCVRVSVYISLHLSTSLHLSPQPCSAAGLRMTLYDFPVCRT